MLDTMGIYMMLSPFRGCLVLLWRIVQALVYLLHALMLGFF